MRSLAPLCLLAMGIAHGAGMSIEEGKKPEVIGSPGTVEETKAFINNDGWNDLHVIARGNVLMHILNGHLVSVVIDDDVKNRRADGLLGVQVHVGPPMKIEYRNFRLKNL